MLKEIYRYKQNIDNWQELIYSLISTLQLKNGFNSRYHPKIWYFEKAEKGIMSQIKFDLIHINKYYYLIRSYLLALNGGVHAAAAAAGAGAGVGW